MAFPISPTNNQTAQVNGITYIYNSADNAWSRLATPFGNLSVNGNLTVSDNITGLYGTFISNLSIGPGLIQQDVLDLNNNNLYNVNTIRIYDPGTSEGIAWEGGSGWNIYESPNDLSNNTGNLQIVLSGTRVFTVDTNQTVNIPSTWEAISTSTGALTVGGGVGVAGNLWVGGNIYVSNLVSISTSTLSVTDPLLYLTASDLSPYNYDIGFFSHFVGGTGSNYQHTGFSRNYLDNTWTLFSNAIAEPGITIDWTDANIIFDPIKVGSANIANTTVSTSTTTGALTVAGGVGIAGNLYIANTGDVSANIGALQVQLTEFATYANTKIGTNSDGNLVVSATTEATDFDTGALIVRGGTAITGSAYVDKLYTTQGLFWAGNGFVITTGGGGGGSGITYNAGTSPASLAGTTGDQWYNTANDTLYEYINDGTNSYWVDVQSPTVNTALVTNHQGNLNVIGNLTATANISTIANLNVTRNANIFGNILGGNLSITRTANIVGNLTVSNVISTGNITTTRNIAANNITASNTIASTNLTISSNISAGNINLSGIVYATGNITGGNVATGTVSATSIISSGTITAAGNITADNITTGNVTITGNLTVLGNTTTLNTEVLKVEDLNITVAANATTGSDANGAGLTVAGADATFTYLNADDSWNLNKKLNATTVSATTVSLTGNVTAANVNTTAVYATDISATSNVTAANINAGAVNVTGSITSTGNLTFAGTVTGGAIKYMFEGANIVAASPPAVTDINVISGAIQYWTSNATTNFTANIRGDATTPLNSILGIGQSSTIALMVPQATAYYVNVVKVDNTTVTPVWQGGATISSGNANSIDLYTFTVIKTADATFKVFASQTRYQHTG